MRKPDYERGNVRLWQGDCLELLPELPERSVDAVVTDSPYSSGGMTRSDRTQKTVSKYVRSDSLNTCREEFHGDNRDQRSFLAWSSLWMCAAYHTCRPGSVICCFTDWRQLPVMTDAIQAGGWCWKGLATWWKPGIRMQRGRFSASAEYVIYGSKGVPIDGQSAPQNVFSCKPIGSEEKDHIAEKPIDVMQWVLGVTFEGATVLDPFVGSGTTIAACVRMSRSAIGFEVDSRSFDIACKRIDASFNSEPLFTQDPDVQPVLFD